MIRLIAIVLLAIALLYFPSIQYSMSLDGAETIYYGFPLPWNSRSLVTSMAKDVFVVPLAIDLVFYAWLATLAVRTAHRLPRNYKIGAMALLFTWGLWCAILMALVVSMGSSFHVWPQPGPFQITAVRLGLGV